MTTCLANVNGIKIAYRLQGKGPPLALIMGYRLNSIDSGENEVSLIGYCFGGVLSLLYGSIFADGPTKNLICFMTPIDFRERKLFANFADRRYFDVDRLIDSVGNMPPEMILSSFEWLRLASRMAGQVQLWDNIWNDEYVKSYRMFDRWATDALPLVGEYFRAITKDLMWDNKLLNGAMSVSGRPAHLSSIKVPILHAVAEHDHIVPVHTRSGWVP
jgi:polyhydroxyalkanoate synthase